MNDSELKQPDDMNPEHSSAENIDSKMSALQAEFNSADAMTHERRSRRIPVVGILFVCLVGLVAVGWNLGWKDQLPSIFGPKLVEVTGHVEYQGKPVNSGYVQTVLIDQNVMGAIGILDDKGRFSLQTDVNGSYEKGAYTGKHKLAVMSSSLAPGQLAPTPLVPQKYFALSSTPLVLNVTGNPVNNDFEFILIEEQQSDVTKDGGSKNKGKNKGKK